MVSGHTTLHIEMMQLQSKLDRHKTDGECAVMQHGVLRVLRGCSESVAPTPINGTIPVLSVTDHGFGPELRLFVTVDTEFSGQVHLELLVSRLGVDRHAFYIAESQNSK